MTPESSALTGITPSSLPFMQLCPEWNSAPSVPHTTSAPAQHAVLSALIREKPDALILLENLGSQEQDAVNWAYNFVRDNIDKPEDCLIQTEQRIHIDVRGLRAGMDGTADILVQTKTKRVIVFDYKSSKYLDCAAQVLSYALGAMQLTTADEATTFLLYGRTQKHARQDITRSKAHVDLANILAGISAKRRGNTEHGIPGEACTYCAHNGNCIASNTLAKAVQKQVDPTLESFDPLDLTRPEQLAKATDIAYTLEAWCKAIKARAKKCLQGGNILPGYKLQSCKGNTVVTNLPNACKTLELDPDIFLHCCSVSVTALDEAVAAKHGIPKKNARELILKTIPDHVETGDTTFSLVADKR